uniref:Uncharacterized protein n=1 Tax=Aegilops tauschii subsp. strangulata TaxID=200361 RepID=A0A453KZ99_AEGTS
RCWAGPAAIHAGGRATCVTPGPPFAAVLPSSRSQITPPHTSPPPDVSGVHLRCGGEHPPLSIPSSPFPPSSPPAPSSVRWRATPCTPSPSISVYR